MHSLNQVWLALSREPSVLELYLPCFINSTTVTHSIVSVTMQWLHDSS